MKRSTPEPWAVPCSPSRSSASCPTWRCSRSPGPPARASPSASAPRPGALGTAVGPLPSIPVFAALPAGSLDFGVRGAGGAGPRRDPGRLVVPARRRKPLRRMALHQDPCPLVHRHGLHPGARRDGRRRRRAARGGTGLAGPRLRRHRAAHGHRTRPAPDGTVRGRGSGDRRRDRLRGRTVAGTPAEAARSGPGDGVHCDAARFAARRSADALSGTAAAIFPAGSGTWRPPAGSGPGGCTAGSPGPG